MSQADSLAQQLNFLLAIESHGLANHLREAVPSLNAATVSVWQDVKQMLEQSAHHCQVLSQIMTENRMAPRAIPFELDVANFHFQDLGFLLPLLMDEKRKQIHAYQKAVSQAPAHVAAQLNGLLDENQTQLDRLEAHHGQIAAGTVLAQRG